MGAGSNSLQGKDKAVWAFDFDGVVCDSCGESSISAWKASARFWPEIFQDSKVQERYQEIIDNMHVVRPVVETGYENLVQIRCLLEGFSTQDILENWHSILPKQMEKWNLDRQTLIKAFGDIRDEWIQNDFETWLEANNIYDGVLEPLKDALQKHECYIVTTKQERYAHAILDKMAHIKWSEERLISTTISGKPKYEILDIIKEKHKDAKVLNFVEDKLGTLLKVINKPDTDWNLYLVDWGYNTESERQQASGESKINILNKQQFKEVLQQIVE